MYSFKELEGKRVKLVSLEEDHAAPLFACSRDSEVWAKYPLKVSTIEEMEAFVQKAIQGRERKDQYPFAVFDKELNEYVGTTRFLRIAEEHQSLNIGSTWYSSKVWRTRVNTETKYLMLKYGFETLNTTRIEIITTTDNTRSQRAIERLGATKEGVLRKKYSNRDYVFYSIIDSDWDDHVKNRLERFLEK